MFFIQNDLNLSSSNSNNIPSSGPSVSTNMSPYCNSSAVLACSTRIVFVPNESVTRLKFGRALDCLSRKDSDAVAEPDCRQITTDKIAPIQPRTPKLQLVRDSLGAISKFLKFLFDRLIYNLWIRLTLRCLHHLANKESKQFCLATPVGFDLRRVLSQDRVD